MGKTAVTTVVVPATAKKAPAKKAGSTAAKKAPAKKAAVKKATTKPKAAEVAAVQCLPGLAVAYAAQTGQVGVQRRVGAQALHFGYQPLREHLIQPVVDALVQPVAVLWNQTKEHDVAIFICIYCYDFC